MTKTAPVIRNMAWESKEKHEMSTKIGDVHISTDPKPSKAETHWREFLKTTSAHGFSRTVPGIRMCYRVSWVLIIIAFYGVMMWSISDVMISYYSWPAMEVSTIKQQPQTFPDISICNQDPISNYEFELLKANESSHLYWYMNYIDSISKYSKASFILLDRYKSAIGLYENLPEEELEMISNKQQDFILSCIYDGDRCKQAVSEFTDPSFLKCFTLEMNDSLVKGTGAHNGVSLIFYVDGSRDETNAGHYNLFSFISASRGARVMVHPHGTFPGISAAGLDIIPGHSTNIAIKSEYVVRLGPPYDNCATNLTIKPTDIPYSSITCRGMCIQAHVIQSCGCASPFTLGNATLCGKLSKSEPNITQSLIEISCAARAILETRNYCNCPPECDRFAYSYTVTEAEWPATKFLQDFYNKFVLQHPNVKSMSAFRDLKTDYDAGFPEPSLVQKSFIRLNVYFESDEVVERRQTPSYTSFTLLSNVGGTLGLWAGISMLTLVELVQLFFDEMLSICNARTKPIGPKM